MSNQDVNFKSVLPNIVGGTVGAALVYYGQRPKTGLIGSLAVTVGYSLLMRSVGEPVIRSLMKRAPAVLEG